MQVLAKDLREAVLQAAIQGKLTEQLSTDSSVDELLESIKKEKEQLVNEKKIKKEKSLSPIKDDEIPFDIPNNWRWEHWGNISNSIEYGVNAGAKDKGNARLVRISDIQNNKIVWNSVPYSIVKDSEIDQYLLNENDILFARTGGTVGKSVVVKNIPTDAKYIFAGYLIRTNYNSLLNHGYLKYFMESALYWEQLKNGTNGSAQPNCNGKTLSKMILPVPPIEEQQRIVERVDQLMAKIDEYEKIEKQLVDLKKEFPGNMRDAILQAAMQGKLTKQLITDSDVNEFVEAIKKEKEKLIKEKKIKKEKALPFIDENEIPFDIPDNWRWERWGNLSNSIEYGVNTGALIDGNAKLVRISDIQNNEIVWATVPYCSIEENEITQYQLKENDILFARTGGTVGKSVVVKNIPDDIGYVFAGYLIRTNYNENLNYKYLKYFMESQLYWGQLRMGTIGSAQPNCNGKTLSKMILPIPPIEEQQRIVKKLERLLPLCEEL